MSCHTFPKTHKHTLAHILIQALTLMFLHIDTLTCVLKVTYSLTHTCAHIHPKRMYLYKHTVACLYIIQTQFTHTLA